MPLARSNRLAAVLLRWSGELLDLIVDYLTYVAVPALALTEADLLPETWRLPAAIAILLSSLFHVADRESKTEEGYFVGFPAIWNIVALFLFVFEPRPVLTLAIVAVLVALTFVPVLCVHPFRVARLRIITLLVTAAWTVGAIGATANSFPSPLWVQALLGVTGAYFVLIGLLRWRYANST